MNISELYASYFPRAEALINQHRLAHELVHNDTLCLQVPSNERYNHVRSELAVHGSLISETEVNGRLIAVFELDEPLRAGTTDDGTAGQWQVSFVELPQPKTGHETEGVRHLQFVTRTGIESFRQRHAHLDFSVRGNPRNRLLELTGEGAVVRFHDKNMGAVIELEQQVQGPKTRVS